ncbi:MAG: PIN domain-containing protein [Patescibacteria group bacterium]
MENRSRVFADSNFFIAFFNPADSLHPRAVAAAKKLYQDDAVLVISNFIFLEVVTVISQRVGRGAALRVGAHLLNDPRKIEVIHIDPILQDSAWRIFQSISVKDAGFVDCSILAVLRAEDIRSLLTFDAADFRKILKNTRVSFYGE